MTSVSRIVLLLLLNAAWQMTLVALLACASDRLLRGAAARYRHALWVAALVICLGLTLSSSLRVSPKSALLPAYTSARVDLPAQPQGAQATQSLVSGRRKLPDLAPVIAFSRHLAPAIAVPYGLLLLYRCCWLLRAWVFARNLRHSARVVELSSSATEALERCRRVLGLRQVPVLSSSQVAVPVTAGTMHPVVIVPERLLREGDLSLLTSALGHEAAHIARRDYLFNLIYECASLPLWFHPALRLVLRRIRQTRELRCDEIVTEQLLEPRIYAQSLVELAGAALPFGRPAPTTTVGIADADILEERIMRILKYSPARLARRGVLVIAALLLVVPCLALAPFTVHVSVRQLVLAAATGQNATTAATQESQPPASEPLKLMTPDGAVTLTTKERPKVGDVVTVGHRRLRITAISPDGEYRAHALTKGSTYAVSENGQYVFTEPAQSPESESRARAERKARLEESDQQRREHREREEAELAARAKRQAELAGIAKIPMDQAIQIAQRQTPGTVVEARLIGERGTATYLVSILTQKGDVNTTTLVLVNAVDGSILNVGGSEQAR
jgi:beta-lactamase regulating signal transducer with metallopeptidase domain/uncharacterized membrane protein YkoI